tara:strand:+ start:2594 stop:3430 length:837 start_codon:yes stop_codon:yes gene_type:complete
MPRKNFLKMPTQIVLEEDVPELTIEMPSRETTDHKDVFENNNSPSPRSPSISPRSPSPMPPTPPPSPIKVKKKPNQKIDLGILSPEQQLELTDTELVYGKSNIEDLTNGQKKMLRPKAARKRRSLQKIILQNDEKADKKAERLRIKEQNAEANKQKKRELDKERYKMKKEKKLEKDRLLKEQRDNDKLEKRLAAELKKRNISLDTPIEKPTVKQPSISTGMDYNSFAGMMDRYNRETGRTAVYKPVAEPKEIKQPIKQHIYDPWGARAKYDRLNSTNF